VTISFSSGPPRPRQRILGPDDSRAPRRRTAHGLTSDERDALVRLQGGKCAICRRPDPRLQVDHDHRHCPGPTGCRQCVRGMLCRSCNSGLGLIEAHLDRLVKYLDR
jgi:hypothetical protein